MAVFFLAKLTKNQDPSKLAHLLIENNYSFYVGQSEREVMALLERPPTHSAQPVQPLNNESDVIVERVVPPGDPVIPPLIDENVIVEDGVVAVPPGNQENEGEIIYRPAMKNEDPLFAVKQESLGVEMFDLEEDEVAPAGGEEPVVDMTQNAPVVTFTTRDLRWKCPIDTCGASFKSEQLLISHMAIHPGVQPFWCSQCPKKYPRSMSLVSHQKHRHGKASNIRIAKKGPGIKKTAAKKSEKKCKGCGKTYLQEASFKRHCTQFNTRHFECKQCNKIFVGTRAEHVRQAHSKKNLR